MKTLFFILVFLIVNNIYGQNKSDSIASKTADNKMNNKDYLVLFSGFISGITVAIFNYYITKRKNSAEIKNLELLPEKTRLEIEKLRKDLNIYSESVTSSVGYQLSDKTELIIYSGMNKEIGFDFKARGGHIWQMVNGVDRAITDEGQGNVNFTTGGLDIQRTNTVGRYELWLQTYSVNNTITSTIPKNAFEARPRYFKISCEVKVIDGEHTLRFVFKGQETGKIFGQNIRRVVEQNWVLVNTYFSFNPTEPCQLRIDDQDVLKAPSSLQMRNIVLTEKVI